MAASSLLTLSDEARCRLEQLSASLTDCPDLAGVRGRASVARLRIGAQQRGPLSRMTFRRSGPATAAFPYPRSTGWLTLR